jgi:hypothetical protein
MAEATKSEATRVKYLQLAQAWLSEAISMSPINENAELPGTSATALAMNYPLGAQSSLAATNGSYGRHQGVFAGRPLSQCEQCFK